MNLANNTLVLVADGRKMLFLRNHGDETQMDLQLEAHQEQDNPLTHEQGTDVPGRSFASVGNRRSAMAETDFHQLQEDRFAAEAADLLRDRALNGDFNARDRGTAAHTRRIAQALSQRSLQSHCRGAT